jgi:hypothetical protein
MKIEPYLHDSLVGFKLDIRNVRIDHQSDEIDQQVGVLPQGCKGGVT